MAEFDPERKTYRQSESTRQPTQRFEILLTLSEKRAVQQRARSEQFSMRRWIIDAIRVGLTHEQQFSMAETDALGESNYQLLALGRNLNQIARCLNAGKYEPVTIERITALSKLIENHTNTVSDAIRASLERWKISQ
ncbi:plasmid mobilization relaxosome protein MobC [Pseudomonas asplenii]|uniref:plasmid mobilization relaxosome protein MobC n=1 Tax=Pseudomonas asplenii TaxID=53407 RepID=UPI0037CA5E7F